MALKNKKIQNVLKYWIIFECVDLYRTSPVLSNFVVEFSSAMPSLPSGSCASGPVVYRTCMRSEGLPPPRMCRVVFEHTWATNPKFMLKLLKWYKCKPELPLKFRKNFCEVLFAAFCGSRFKKTKYLRAVWLGFRAQYSYCHQEFPDLFFVAHVCPHS